MKFLFYFIQYMLKQQFNNPLLNILKYEVMTYIYVFYMLYTILLSTFIITGQ